MAILCNHSLLSFANVIQIWDYLETLFYREEGYMDQYSGIIPEMLYAESNPIRKMAVEIFNGHKEAYTREEISEVVDQRYFGFSSLISLAESEASFLKSKMVDTMMRRLNEGSLRKFIEATCYKEMCQKGTQLVNVYISESLKRVKDISRLSVMTNEEKLEFLDSPENLDAFFNTSWSSASFATMGYRSFDEYAMSGQATELLHGLQVIKGIKSLHVMDLGGGVGQALYDLKKAHPELVTYNATRDEEYCHYPTDYHVIGFMERMPLGLKEKIDLIFSNMTTRYLAYSDLVIQNCVSMLSSGGIMNVFFSSERSDNHLEDDIKCRMKKAYDFLRDMEHSGLIKLDIISRFTSNFGGSFKSGEETLYPAATVFVQKL